MLRYLPLLVLPLLVSLAAPAAAQIVDPTPVVFLPGGATVEECRRQWQTSAAVRARTAPLVFATVSRTIDGARRVDANDYTEAVRAVLQTGLVRARQATVLRAVPVYPLGDAVRIELAAGETLPVLTRGAEGTAQFMWRERIHEGELPGFSISTSSPEDELETLREPFVELWVRLVEHDAERPAAWLNTSQAGVIERESFCR